MRLTYKQRIFFYFFVIFALFAACIIILEQKEEKKHNTIALETKLDGYAGIIDAYISQHKLKDTTINNVRRLVEIMPTDIRVTIINLEGKVLFDKDVADVNSFDNHLDRPEIRNALFQSSGTHIRMSASTQQEYIYYAKHYPSYYVRVALPYNIETKGLLEADNYFIYIVIAIFVIVLLLLNYAASRFGKSISQLKDFTTNIKDGKAIPNNVRFPDDELGDIGGQLVEIFDQQEKIKHKIEIEREKLIQHFQFSEEGLCIFKPNRDKIYANTHFIQYLNLIVDNPTFDIHSVFQDEHFNPISEFLTNKDRTENNCVFQISENGKIFSVQTIIFDDNSFEITIKNVTRIEKTRLMKQEMTNNIAHELRTPVTSLRGYLETLTEQNLPEEKQKQFIDRAYSQTIRLSNLIEDVSLISKIEEGASLFKLEKIKLSQLINDLRIDMIDRLKQSGISFQTTVPDNLVVNGNYTLLYSIFRNLIDNTINYAGEGTEIKISNYMEDDGYYYLSYYDSGKGVPEEYLNRLFERFYRVNEGRTRETGGSGLGLSIVKNAILFHKGEIQVKNRTGGGLEFLFTLKK